MCDAYAVGTQALMLLALIGECQGKNPDDDMYLERARALLDPLVPANENSALPPVVPPRTPSERANSSELQGLKKGSITPGYPDGHCTLCRNAGFVNGGTAP